MDNIRLLRWQNGAQTVPVGIAIRRLSPVSSASSSEPAAFVTANPDSS
jgi:hypothetical protein